MRKMTLLLILLLSAVTGYSKIQDYGFKPLPQKLRYKEDFYRIYNVWLYADEDSITRNIFYLELAFALPFDHPIKALVPITNELQYQKYQNLLMMHICLMLTKEYITYGNYYMKEKIYFFNQEFFEDYKWAFDHAQLRYEHARGYWDYAIQYAQKADAIKGPKMDMQFGGKNFDFEDELYRIKNGILDYYIVIDQRMAKVEANRKIINDYQNSQKNTP